MTDETRDRLIMVLAKALIEHMGTVDFLSPVCHELKEVYADALRERDNPAEAR